MEFIKCCLHEHELEMIYWSMIKLTVAKLLQKTSHLPLEVSYCQFVLRKCCSHPNPSPVADESCLNLKNVNTGAVSL